MRPLETRIDYIDQLAQLLARGEEILAQITRLDGTFGTARVVGVWPLSSFKTIAQVTRRYEDALDRFVRETLDRRMDKVDFRRAHRALLRSGIAEEAYKEGIREGGSTQPDDDYDAEDVLKVAKWMDEQLGYVNGFADAIWEASGVGADEAKRDAVLARVPTWVASLQNLGDLGRLAAMGDPMLTFDGKDGIESCAECQRYKLQRHRKSWWERRDLLRRNGNENYTCGRWEGHCPHFFRNDKGEVIVA